MRPISLRALVGTIALIVAIAITVSIPAGYFLAAYSIKSTLVAEHAEESARGLARYIYTHNTLWQFQSARLFELLETQTSHVKQRQRAFDASGKLVVEVGPPVPAPTLLQSAPVVVAGTVVGRMEVEASLRPLLLNTSIAAVIGFILGFGAYLAVRVYPLRALDRTNEALARSEERYRLVQEAVSDGLWDRNLVTDEEYFSPRLKAIFGYTNDDLPNTVTSFFELVHPDDKAALTEALRAHLEEEQPYALDYRVRCKSGEYRWVHSRGTALRDAAGRPVRMVGAITDINERKFAAALLEESHDSLLRAEAMAQMGHYRYERGAAALVWSDGLYRIVGQSITSFTPTLNVVAELIHPDDRPALERLRQDAMAGIEGPPVTMRIVKDDGQIVFIENWASPLRASDGAVIGMFGTVQDVTAHRQAQ